MARRSTNRKAARRAERTQEAAEIERRLAPLKKRLAGQDLVDGMVGALKDHQDARAERVRTKMLRQATRRWRSARARGQNMGPDPRLVLKRAA
ncbi:hypothetical protein D3272_26470 [Lichenibacterium ramalinae]|uniref:Uncharacterized protein n=1 Tax=Lichenibacterium ramalinae TaxID=2316527 RepID=A0A4Q2R648_9HYPH|nr:hypothetical protein D3272_26470 [Lichenibacterium ramalinae]